jgi:PAS domain-containing protein
MPVSEPAPPIRQPLKVLLFQPNRVRSDDVVAELEGAGFQVHADIVENLEAFEERLRAGRYDLAINGVQFASAVQTLELHRRRAEEAALEAAGRVDALFEACPLGIISLDLDGSVRMWSRGAEQIFGWREEEVLGKKLPTIPKDQEQEYHRLLQAQFSGTSHAGVPGMETCTVCGAETLLFEAGTPICIACSNKGTDRQQTDADKLQDLRSLCSGNRGESKAVNLQSELNPWSETRS